MQPQSRPPEQRLVTTFAVRETSRLSALARLGALTKTSILVKADSLPFLQEPVSLVTQHATVFAVATEILRGPEPYSIRQQGELLIVFSTRHRSRMLTLPLGPFRFTGDSLSALSALLGSQVSAAIGCEPSGWAITGASLDLAIPPIQLTSATFEQIAALVAQSPEPSMWVVEPDPTDTGCVPDPGAHWQMGLYGFGRLFTGCDTPFRESTGPSFVVAPTNVSPRQQPVPTLFYPDPSPVSNLGQPIQTPCRTTLGHGFSRVPHP